jgi:hypothetical protein
MHGATIKIKKRIPFIFNDESTRSCICLRLDLYMSHVKYAPQRIAFIFLIPPPIPLRAPVAVNVPGVTSRYHGTVREISKVTRKSAA